MTQQMSAVVRRTITVAASQQRAFDVFTAGLGGWWPKDYHIGQAAMADFVLEPKAGGRWYELGVDGTQCDTGRVIAYEPPQRVVLAWQLNEQWQYDPDPAHASEVEVRFIAEGPSQTRVELEHRGFERHGAAADDVRAGVDAPTGWTYVLELFAQHAAV
ncbi:MAG TPA: SRPBCC family protein [Chloroflexota bacterium]|nr:SRPBCC family protein [Chloroflexota bacterium]